MKFFVFMLVCDCIIPVMMIILGMVMWKKIPKNINAVYGYRTPMSMKNMDTWKFAHEMAGKIWVKTGSILLIPSLLIHIPFLKSDASTIGNLGLIICFVQVAVLVISIMPVEKKLKKTFDENGNRR